MIDGDFSPLIERLDQLAGRINPTARKRLASEVATDLRTSNAKRIKANLQPPADEAMTPRKQKVRQARLRSKRLRTARAGRKRSIRGAKMFKRVSTARFLRKKVTAEEATVGFTGSTARIMRVHQYGLTDAVDRRPGVTTVKYAKRVVIGFTAADREKILERALARLGE